MLNDLYIEVQAELNKDGLGYLKPLHLNSFVNKAIRTAYNSAFIKNKSNIRKQNWMLDGKHFANLSELSKQLLEYYSKETALSNPFTKPTDLEYIIDVYSGNVKCEKVSYSDLKKVQRNIYCSPSNCAPMCSLIGDTIKVNPITISDIDLHYIRKPKKAKWTFELVDEVPMFDDTANDYQDIDMPETYFDELVSLVVESASKMLRELNMTQLENQDQATEQQLENQQ